MTDNTPKTRVISGVTVTKVGMNRFECDFGVDEFGDAVVFTLRRPDIASVVMSAGADDIPNVFRGQVLEMLSGRQTATAVGVNSLDTGAQPQDGLSEQDMPKLDRMIRLVVDAAFGADPRYNADGPDSFSYLDLSMEMKLWTFSWSMPREVAALESFPDHGQPTHVGSAPDGEVLRAEAVGTASGAE